MAAAPPAGRGATGCGREAVTDFANDEETGSYVLGQGGYPSKDGIIQCDIAIMEGPHPGHFGVAAALTGIGTPLAVTHKIMKTTTHCVLGRKGALAFAREQDFTIEDNKNLMTKQSAEAYQGLSPMDAFQTVLQDILQQVRKENMFEFGIITINMKGKAGAASSVPF